MGYASGKVIKLTAKLNPADTSLTANVDVGVTAGRLYFVNDLQEEWIDFTGVAASGSNFVYSGLTRGLSQTADPATAGTGKTWIAGNSGTLVAMHDQLVDKQNNNTFSGTQTFTDIDFTGTTTGGLKVKSLTTAQRNAITPANGMIVYDTTLGEHYQYIGGAWSAISAGSTQPNASSTVAGKVEIATSAESIAGTDTGGTGALLSVLPSDIAANEQSGTFLYAADAGANDTYVIALTPALTAYTTGQVIRFKPNTVNTGACTINVNGLGAKSIKLIDGTDPLNGDLASGRIYDLVYDGTNFVLQQVPERATTAEALAGTNTTDYITPKQTKDNYGFVLNGTLSTKTASLTVNPAVSTSASFLLTNHTVANIALSAYFGNSSLQISTDDINWSNLYLNTAPSSSTVSTNFNFALKGGNYYRIRVETTATGSLVAASGTLTYTI